MTDDIKAALLLAKNALEALSNSGDPSGLQGHALDAIDTVLRGAILHTPNAKYAIVLLCDADRLTASNCFISDFYQYVHHHDDCLSRINQALGCSCGLEKIITNFGPIYYLVSIDKSSMWNVIGGTAPGSRDA